jgi:type I restriction enzyme M protein
MEGMAGRKKKTDKAAVEMEVAADEELAIAEEDVSDEDAVPEDEIICRLTQERRKVTPEEEVIQALIDQLHRE